jgi:chloramphenicol 3-O-phosphotransferase
MIILLNGAFGAGKTTAAQVLVQKIPNAMIFDPEEVGFFLRNILKPIDPQDEDFQHYSLWRTLVIETAKLIQERYKRNLIVPITIWRKTYLEEITNGFKRTDPDFYHFCLVAPAATIRERLLARGEEPNSWAERQIESCTAAFVTPMFDIKVNTTTKSPDEVVEDILDILSSKNPSYLS